MKDRVFDEFLDRLDAEELRAIFQGIRAAGGVRGRVLEILVVYMAMTETERAATQVLFDDLPTDDSGIG